MAVLELMHSDRFVDSAPAEIHATLLDEKVYHCSVRTMYRLLASCQETKERRNQRVHPAYEKPELLATKPNECWSWDITRLRGPTKWSYYYLYVIMDIFSRYVVTAQPSPGADPSPPVPASVTQEVRPWRDARSEARTTHRAA